MQWGALQWRSIAGRGVRCRGRCTAMGGCQGPWRGVAPEGPAEPVVGRRPCARTPLGVPVPPGGPWPGRSGAGRGSCEAADGTARGRAPHSIAHGRGRARPGAAPASRPCVGRSELSHGGLAAPLTPSMRGTEGLHPPPPPPPPTAAGHQCHELRSLSQRWGRGAAAPAASFPLPRQPRGRGTGDGHHPWPADEP